MQNSMYTGVFASLTSEHRMAMISNNLANVNTAGYKADALAFKDTMINFAHDYIREPLEHLRSDPLFPEASLRARTRIADRQTDFSQGSMVYSGNPLDIAIVGEGFYRVQTPNGEFLTRSSSLMKGADGTLMTSQGFAVQGTGGSIVIPPGAGNVQVTSDGRISANNAEIGQLAVVSIANMQNLDKVGNNLYKIPDNTEFTNPIENGTMVSQGYTEAANVNAVYEMVNMIEVQRTFEAHQKVMSTADSIDRELINRVSRPK